MSWSSLSPVHGVATKKTILHRISAKGVPGSSADEENLSEVTSPIMCTGGQHLALFSRYHNIWRGTGEGTMERMWILYTTCSCSECQELQGQIACKAAKAKGETRQDRTEPPAQVVNSGNVIMPHHSLCFMCILNKQTNKNKQCSSTETKFKQY